jgi:hypothetical protein
MNRDKNRDKTPRPSIGIDAVGAVVGALQCAPYHHTASVRQGASCRGVTWFAR